MFHKLLEINLRLWLNTIKFVSYRLIKLIQVANVCFISFSRLKGFIKSNNAIQIT